MRQVGSKVPRSTMDPLLVPRSCSRRSRPSPFQSRGGSRFSRKSSICSALSTNRAFVCNTHYPLVNKHRPWKWPIFSGNQSSRVYWQIYWRVANIKKNNRCRITIPDLRQQLAVKPFQVLEKFLPPLEHQAAVIFEPRSMTFHTEACLTEVVQVVLVIWDVTRSS